MGWKTHRAVTQAAGNTFAVLDTFAAPTAPAVAPIDLPTKFPEDSYYQVKSVEMVVELFDAAGALVAPSTLDFTMQAFEIDRPAAGVAALLAYPTTGFTGMVPYEPRALAAATGPREIIIGIMAQSGAAGANFTDWQIRWRELG